MIFPNKSDRKLSNMNRALEIITHNDSDMIEQIFALLINQTRNADLTLYDIRAGNVMYSTIYNEDILSLSVNYLRKNTNFPEYMYFGNSNGVMPSEDDTAIEVVSLENTNVYIILLCEYHGEPVKIGYLDETMPLVNMLFIASEIQILSKGKDSLLKRDSLTMLPDREALYEFLMDAVDNSKRYSIGLITISNMKKIIRDKGLMYGERLIRMLSDSIQLEVTRLIGERGLVYRTGRYNFTVPLPLDLYDAGNRFENLLDFIFKEYEEVTATCVVTPLISDVYRSVYICECYALEAEDDSVTVVRDFIPEKDVSDYMHVERTFLEPMERKCEEPEKDETITRVSKDILKKEHETGLPAEGEVNNTEANNDELGEEMFFDLFGDNES